MNRQLIAAGLLAAGLIPAACHLHSGTFGEQVGPVEPDDSYQPAPMSSLPIVPAASDAAPDAATDAPATDAPTEADSSETAPSKPAPVPSAPAP